jgi:hypothetical protein
MMILMMMMMMKCISETGKGRVHSTCHCGERLAVVALPGAAASKQVTYHLPPTQ